MGERKSGGGSPIKFIDSDGNELILEGTLRVPVKLVDVDGREIEVDSAYPSLVEIDIEHHHIHEGSHYVVEDYDGDVDIASPKYWLLISPNTATRIHIFIKGFANAAGVWYMYEDATVAGGNEGTPITPVNNDRNSGNASTLSVYKDPTVGADGTEISAVLVPSAGKKEGGFTERNEEIILKQNIKYLVKFVPVSNDTKISTALEWYEVS